MKKKFKKLIFALRKARIFKKQAEKELTILTCGFLTLPHLEKNFPFQPFMYVLTFNKYHPLSQIQSLNIWFSKLFFLALSSISQGWL